LTNFRRRRIVNGLSVANSDVLQISRLNETFLYWIKFGLFLSELYSLAAWRRLFSLVIVPPLTVGKQNKTQERTLKTVHLNITILTAHTTKLKL